MSNIITAITDFYNQYSSFVFVLLFGVAMLIICIHKTRDVLNNYERIEGTCLTAPTQAAPFRRAVNAKFSYTYNGQQYENELLHSSNGEGTYTPNLVYNIYINKSNPNKILCGGAFMTYLMGNAVSVTIIVTAFVWCL